MSAIRYLKSVNSLTNNGDDLGSRWENILFKLTTRFTVAVLIGSSVLLGATEFFGKPIQCQTSLPENVINTYCWVTSTFTISDYYDRELGVVMAHPGVKHNTLQTDYEIRQKWTFHNYYQWVVFFLFFEAALCYLPKIMWNSLEGGLMKSLSESLLINNSIKVDKAKEKKVVTYIMTHIKMHKLYACKYFFCEVLCLVVIIAQLFLIDAFLGGEFMTYGVKVAQYADMDQEERVDPMIYIFPRMTKCNFHLYGPSGTVQVRDALCLLPQNILNEKVFIFLWFWFLILACGLIVVLTFRACIIAFPQIRPHLIYYRNKSVPIETIKVVIKKTSFGDWFVLYCLSGLIDPAVYKDIMMNVSKEIETEDSNKASSSNYYPSANVNGNNGNASAPAMYCQSSV